MDKDQFLKWLGRITAWYLGVAPTDLWATYRAFESDLDRLVELHESLENEVKPILEDRARATKARD